MPMPDDFNPNVKEPIEERCPECGWDGGGADEMAQNRLVKLWIAVGRHPGIKISCYGDDAAETWNRLARALDSYARVASVSEGSGDNSVTCDE